MYGAAPMQSSAEQENIPPITIANPNDRTIHENSDETTPMDTVQYQLPSKENIDQHEHICFQDANAKIVRTRTISSWTSHCEFLCCTSGLRLHCLTEQMRLISKHEAIYREDCQRERLLKRSVPTNVFEISEPKSWIPQGTLLGHTHLHNGKITRLEFLWNRH